MAYSLFLDDERVPSFLKDQGYPPEICDREWAIARSYDEAVAIMSQCGIPEMMSFDHDLGPGNSGKYVAAWMVETHMDGEHFFPTNFSYMVHSMNPIGAANIRGLMDGFLRDVLHA